MTGRANRVRGTLGRAVLPMAVAILATLASGTLASGARAGDYKPITNYILRCAGCHSLDGSGHPVGGIPDFRGFIGAFAGEDDGRTYVLHVPGVAGSGLSAGETAAVLNLVMGKWGGASLPADFRPFTEAEVAERRLRPVADVVVLRREIAARLQRTGVAMAEYPWP